VAISPTDCVLVWKFDRSARSARHLLAALEEFNHVGVRFVSVRDQVDTASPMGRAMFTTIIDAMAELESSLINASRKIELAYQAELGGIKSQILRCPDPVLVRP
jgi:DNA invertase Pin-like site-specific DNA recombinase